MRAVAFWFEKAASLHDDHAKADKQECEAPPIEIQFFHSKNLCF